MSSWHNVRWVARQKKSGVENPPLVRRRRVAPVESFSKRMYAVFFDIENDTKHYDYSKGHLKLPSDNTLRRYILHKGAYVSPPRQRGKRHT